MECCVQEMCYPVRCDAHSAMRCNDGLVRAFSGAFTSRLQVVPNEKVVSAAYDFEVIKAEVEIAEGVGLGVE